MINSTSETWAVFWDRICLMGVVLIPSTYIHFNYIFLGYVQRYRWFIIGNYLISAFFLIVNFTPLFVAHNSPKFGLNFYTDPGPLYLPFVIYFFMTSIFTIFVLYSGQKTVSAIRKKQISLLFWSALLGYSLGGFNYNPSFGIGPAYLPLIGNIGVVAYALIVAYTITKHHLMDISVIISRTVAWVITVVFLGAIYLGLAWFYRTSISSSIDWVFLAWTVLYGIMVGESFHRIRLFIQTTSDKVFLRGKYDYYKELSDASSRVGQKLSLPDILKVLYDTFHNVVEIANPRVFLPEYFTETEITSNRYLIYNAENSEPDRTGAEIRMNSPLIEKLIAERKPVHDIKELKGVLAVPCLLEDRLIAVFVLGPKLSEDRYTEEDLRLLEVLANQAAITLDHTRSYEKIKTDLDVAQRQLERSQRLVSLGTLTAGVTHEIRNPLTVIRSETERLANEARDLAYLKQFRNLLLKHIDRISGIVERMLGLAKEKTRQEIDINLNDVINSTLELFGSSSVTVKKELSSIPAIKGDPQELQEVFVNLIQNAVEAMPGGGTLTIKTYTGDRRVIVEVSDTGKGIPEEIREKIFDPFYSTRHEGVGLGLSIVYRIIREHGADIKVTSEVGKGTTFKLLF